MIFLGGVSCAVPDCPDTKNPNDNHDIPWMTDGAARKGPPVAIVLHTTSGTKGEELHTPPPPSEHAEQLARYQAGTERDVSWDFTVDLDGTIVQHNDPSAPCGGRKAAWYSWHAGSVNGWTLGIEIVQGPRRVVYELQLRVATAFVTFLCDHYGIPKRVPCDASGKPWDKSIFEVVSTKRGGRQRRWQGVLGHCNVTTPDSRGPWDPGDHVRGALLDGGFTPFNIEELAKR